MKKEYYYYWFNLGMGPYIRHPNTEKFSSIEAAEEACRKMGYWFDLSQSVTVKEWESHAVVKTLK